MSNEKQKNELVLANKIEAKLRETKELNVFPLTATHRKELRELKNKNLGNLRNQLSNIKRLKQDEFVSKYKDNLKKELELTTDHLNKLNFEWDDFVNTIEEFVKKRKTIEETLKHVSYAYGYNNIAHLTVKKDELMRKILVDHDKASQAILKKQFEKVYGKKFSEFDKKIDDLETKYEEAINFGDLSIVKEIYYLLKDADTFFGDLSKIQIK